ncbi:hypothetical protein Syun_015185 [Stephania yunnanensis]|uniref:Uncharacterized protein n=1 Tax=Stephania yunnanensis TaxID=152371 RepID=A0AAP0JMW8_9MAGN
MDTPVVKGDEEEHEEGPVRTPKSFRGSEMQQWEAHFFARQIIPTKDSAFSKGAICTCGRHLSATSAPHTLPAQLLVLLPPPLLPPLPLCARVWCRCSPAALCSRVCSLSTELLPHPSIYTPTSLVTGLPSRDPYRPYPCIPTETDAENILCIGFGKEMMGMR